MASRSQTTTDHQTIRDWVEERGGSPVSIKGTGDESDPGLLRIDFPDSDSDEPFEKIGWDDFFDKFDAKKLAFLYQDTRSDGSRSYFCKLIDRD